MFTEITEELTIRSKHEWLTEKEAHEAHVDELVGNYLVNRSRHIKDPVIDFLFEYYSFRPSQLKKWSPGIGIGLEYEDRELLPDLREWSLQNNIAHLEVSRFPEARRSSMEWILTLLRNTMGKKPSFGCFGMHEWAMVYKSELPRHSQVPLRMNPVELAEFVESRPLVCTHFDAFRFFTEPAAPLNKHELSRATFQDMEQPGCIHSNMDLYKWAFKMHPWISSKLILQAFELALEARYVDMQASPYDLSEYDLNPIKIETEEGRTIYKREQERIWEKGKIVRNLLIDSYERLHKLLEKKNKRHYVGV